MQLRREITPIEKKISLFQLTDRPNIIRVSVKDHLNIVDKPQPCAKAGRIYKLSEADDIENISTACIRHLHGKVTRDCLTNCCVLVMHTHRQVQYAVTVIIFA